MTSTDSTASGTNPAASTPPAPTQSSILGGAFSTLWNNLENDEWNIVGPILNTHLTNAKNDANLIAQVGQFEAIKADVVAAFPEMADAVVKDTTGALQTIVNAEAALFQAKQAGTAITAATTAAPQGNASASAGSQSNG